MHEIHCDGCGTVLGEYEWWDVNAYYDAGCDDVALCDWCLFGWAGAEIGGEG